MNNSRISICFSKLKKEKKCKNCIFDIHDECLTKWYIKKKSELLYSTYISPNLHLNYNILLIREFFRRILGSES